MKFTQTPTPLCLGETGIRQMTFDGMYYYFTSYTHPHIIQTTTAFEPLRHFTTGRTYDCLCFDPKLCCYWATISGCCSRVFRLTLDFEEIECRVLLTPFQGKITGLSFHGCHHSLWVACPCGVLEYFIETEDVTIMPSISGCITSILSICPAYLVVTRQGKTQLLHVFFETGEKIKEIPLPSSLSVRNFLYQPCLCETPHIDFLLTTGGCYPQIAQVPTSNYEFGFEPCFCNKQLCEKLCCAPLSCRPVDDVLESIALVEAALSHILNAQGEQLQKVVAESTSVEDLLCANKQVNDTITKVTHLEMILHNKIEALSHLCHSDNGGGCQQCQVSCRVDCQSVDDI